MRLNADQREDLADARSLLLAAAHNAGAVQAGPEPEQALANALRMAMQALATLQRVADAKDVGPAPERDGASA